MADHLIVLAGALATILLFGVGWRERFRWTPTIERRLFRRPLALEARVLGLEAALATQRKLSAAMDRRVDGVALEVADHLLSCHPKERVKAAPVKAAAKKAPAKKAASRTSRPASSAPAKPAPSRRA